MNEVLEKIQKIGIVPVVVLNDPRQGENFYLMYMEDIIKANINRMFPGYDLDCSYCCKIC